MCDYHLYNYYQHQIQEHFKNQVVVAVVVVVHEDINNDDGDTG